MKTIKWGDAIKESEFTEAVTEIKKEFYLKGLKDGIEMVSNSGLIDWESSLEFPKFNFEELFKRRK